MISILHDEGKIRFDEQGLAHYQYFINDHLGNTRVIFEKLNDSVYLAQENHYGVWGELLQGIGTSGDWKFLFQGKEYVDAFGLNIYDFGWRMGDPFIGRWASTDPADQFQNMTGYGYMANNPAVYIDPDGRIVPLVIAAGAALVVGALNLWSNWGKIKGGGWKAFAQGAAYFVSGAVGGGVSVVNPALGGTITAGGNFVTDIATGNLPDLKNSKNPVWDGFKYAGGLALDGLGAAGAGSLAKFGTAKLASFFSSEAVSSVNGVIGVAKVGSEVGNFSLQGTAELVIKPAVKGVGRSMMAQAGKQSLNYVDDVAGNGFKSFEAFKRAYGGAGKGNAWHHIVEQHADNISKFGAETIHNTDNLMLLPDNAGSIHRKVTGFYNSLMPGTKMRVRDYVKTLNFEEQYKFGIEALKKFGWIPK